MIKPLLVHSKEFDPAVEGKWWLCELMWGVEASATAKGEFWASSVTETDLKPLNLQRIARSARARLDEANTCLKSELVASRVAIKSLSPEPDSCMLEGSLKSYNLDNATLTVRTIDGPVIIPFCITEEMPYVGGAEMLKVVPLIELRTTIPYKF